MQIGYTVIYEIFIIEKQLEFSKSFHINRLNHHRT